MSDVKGRVAWVMQRGECVVRDVKGLVTWVMRRGECVVRDVKGLVTWVMQRGDCVMSDMKGRVTWVMQRGECMHLCRIGRHDLSWTVREKPRRSDSHGNVAFAHTRCTSNHKHSRTTLFAITTSPFDSVFVAGATSCCVTSHPSL
jgi:hypothetical protein